MPACIASMAKGAGRVRVHPKPQTLNPKEKGGADQFGHFSHLSAGGAALLEAASAPSGSESGLLSLVCEGSRSSVKSKRCRVT